MTGESDRDRSVERMLRRSLSPRAHVSSSASCLDAETLAAWADGELDRDRRGAAESHVAGCARCQAVLAALVRTAPPAEAKQPWWRVSRLTWLVPLTAAATALVIWIAVPENQPSRLPQPTAQPAAPSPAATPTPPPPASPEQNQRESPRAAAATEKAAAPASEPMPLAEPSSAALAKTAPAAPEAPRDRLDAAPESRRAELKAEADTAAPAPPAAAAPAVSRAAPAAPAPARAPAGATAQAFSNAARQLTRIPIEIVSADSNSRWRITGGRSVEHSTDGGMTWEAQATGASGEVLAGASPSSTVCWLAGRDGLVLLTIDGRQWQRIAFPEMTDLAAVRAMDATAAAITTLDGRTFRTNDGGRTWVR